MTYFQACCLLVFSILGTAICIDPVTAFVIGNPIFVIKRITFAIYYWVVTSPRLIVAFTFAFPFTAIRYYTHLAEQYREVFPEVFDEDGNFIPEEDEEDVE